MNAIGRSLGFGIAYIASLLPALSQVAAAPSAVPISANSNLQTFLNTKQALLEQQQALRVQGATPAQMAAWRKQHAAQFAAMQQEAEALAASSFLQLRPENIQPNIPEGSSPTLKAYLTTQAALANAMASLHNQLVRSLPANATQAQIQQAQRQAMQLFRQQHAADLQAQTQRAQALAAESAASISPVQLQQRTARLAALRQARAQDPSASAQPQQQAQTLSQPATPTTN